jgi:hypothetical protein
LDSPFKQLRIMPEDPLMKLIQHNIFLFCNFSK